MAFAILSSIIVDTVSTVSGHHLNTMRILQSNQGNTSGSMTEIIAMVHGI